MPLSQADRERTRRFRESFHARYASDQRFGPVQREDREDESTLASRFAVGPQLWMELSLRPLLPQVRVGILTDDRWKSEELEQVIEDSGDSMSEFIEMGFEAAGLSWKEPAVEHYRDQGKYFYFATPLELDSLEALEDGALLERVGRMFEGYYEAFRPAIQKS